jgi:hypothetical protein
MICELAPIKAHFRRKNVVESEDVLSLNTYRKFNGFMCHARWDRRLSTYCLAGCKVSISGSEIGHALAYCTETIVCDRIDSMMPMILRKIRMLVYTYTNSFPSTSSI